MLAWGRNESGGGYDTFRFACQNLNGKQSNHTTSSCSIMVYAVTSCCSAYKTVTLIPKVNISPNPKCPDSLSPGVTLHDLDDDTRLYVHLHV